MKAGLRWITKKAARRCVAAFSWASGWLFLRRLAGGTGQVRVLTYHRVRNVAGDPFSVTVEEFDRQMTWLRAQQAVVSLEDLLSFLRGQRAVPKDAVLVTIDDGYVDLLYWRATGAGQAPHPGGGIHHGRRDVNRRWYAGSQTICRGSRGSSSARRRRRVARVGASIDGSDDRRRRRLPGRSLSSGIGTADRPSAQGFCVPVRHEARLQRLHRRSAACRRYECAFTSQHGPVTPGSDPMELRRIKIEGGDPFWVFRLAVRGGLDGWRLIDLLGARFQSSERKSVRDDPAPQTRHSATVRFSGRPLN